MADREPEAEICRRFAPRIRGYGLLHLRREAAAADLVQDVLIVVLQALRSGRIADGPDLPRFVLATCRNLAFDRSRTEGRRARILAGVAPEIVPPADEERLDHDRLRRCLEKLPERQREVLVMTFFEDLSADEIGAALSLSAGNVRVLRHRALVAVRGCVGDTPP